MLAPVSRAPNANGRSTGGDKALADTLRLVHIGLNTLLVVVVGVHVAAALKHHFLDGDAVLARMLPIRKRNPSLP